MPAEITEDLKTSDHNKTITCIDCIGAVFSLIFSLFGM